MLKLFRIEGEGAYSGAMCVVAAPNRDFAILNAKSHDKYFFTVPIVVEELPGQYIGNPGIIAFFSFSE